MDDVRIYMNSKLDQLLLSPFYEQCCNLTQRILREINGVLNNVSNTACLAYSETCRITAIFISPSFHESIYGSFKTNVHHVYHTLNAFYIPLIERLRKAAYPLDSSHLVIGTGGLLIGSYTTYLFTRFVFPQIHTRYITQIRAVVASNDKEYQGVSYVEKVPIPLILGPNDVLIHVKAAALDFIDVDVVFGRRRVLRELIKRECYPIILGRDCTGTIVDTGCNVTRFLPKDEVWCVVPFWKTGTMIEFVSIEECYVSHKPERLDFFDAASLPLSGCIALDCVKRRAGIVCRKSGRGKRVLVHCGNTATGCIIIQLCALYNVSITTSCLSRAVNKMIDAGAQNILLLDQIGPDAEPSKRFDIIFNTMGESDDEFCRNHLVENGLIIDASTMNYVPKDKSNDFYSSLYSVWLKFLNKLGINLWEDVLTNASVLDELSNLVNEGALYPVSDSLFNFKHCERAVSFLQVGKVVGKPIIYFDETASSVYYKEAEEGGFFMCPLR